MERRIILAIALMMVIVLAPTFFAPPPAPPELAPDSALAAVDTQMAPAALDTAPPVAPVAADSTTPDSMPATTVRAAAPLYTAEFSSRGARLTSFTLTDYHTMALGDSGQVELLHPGSTLFGLSLVTGSDTTDMSGWDFVPSATDLSVGEGTPLTFTASRGSIGVEVTYTLYPDYRVRVAGHLSGVPTDGGLLLIQMGDGIRNTENDSTQNFRSYAVVTKSSATDRSDFRSFDPGERRILDGPFEWAAIKSKYFVVSVFAFDTANVGGRLTGLAAHAPADAAKDPTRVDVSAAFPVTATGEFGWTSYLGPLKYDNLTAMGHDFDDVNPYGWPGLRAIMRFFAVPVRWLLVEMHQRLHLEYGLVLVLFGILVRVLLWPLNQKAMRANMKMMEIQPHLKSAQEKYKENPQQLQLEMFRLYKEYGVNPMSGCWPMLLPMPILFALFFVFQNAIELRGQSFLWLNDLSQHDPLYIIPILMGLSMYVLSKVGQRGMPPNPQMKMMLYLMPGMMTFFFLKFASGLNLYYAVSNIASIPQQWLIARERERRTVKAIVDVKTRSKKA